MATKIITVSVREDVERRFRRVAASKDGKKKGYRLHSRPRRRVRM